MASRPSLGQASSHAFLDMHRASTISAPTERKRCTVCLSGVPTRPRGKKETIMSQSGQQHPKADVGGQRTDPRKSDEKKSGAAAGVRETIASGKKPVAKSDAKK